MNKSEASIFSLNVRGLIAVTKRRKLVTWLKHQSAKVILLQETHCTKAKLKQFTNSWHGKSVYGLTESSHSRGVGVLFDPKLDVDIKNTYDKNDGRTILLNVSIEGKQVTIVNVYAPNDINDRCKYFEELATWVLEKADNMEHVVLGGDFNCSLNICDRSTRTHIDDKSRNALINMLGKLNIVDVWTGKDKPLSGGHFTWKDSVTKSRIDYFFASKLAMLNIIDVHSKIVITDQIGKRLTDHKALILRMKIETPDKGPGYWKFNTTLLEDEQYCNAIVNLINEVFSDTNLDSIAHSMKWDILKLRIKEVSIKFSVKKALRVRNEKAELESEQDIIEKLPHINDDTLLRKEAIQNRLHEIYTEFSNGAKLRAKLQSVNETECNSEFFHCIEQSRQSKNVIDCLTRDDNNDTTDQHEILKNDRRI